LRAAIDEQEVALTGKKVLLASLEEKKEADLRTMSRLQNDISSVENEVKAKQEDIVACDNQLAGLAQAIETEQALLKETYLNLARCEAALTTDWR